MKKYKIEVTASDETSALRVMRHLLDLIDSGQPAKSYFVSRTYGNAVCECADVDFVPFLARLTPKQLAEFRRGMAKIRRNFVRRMKRRHNARLDRQEEAR